MIKCNNNCWVVWCNMAVQRTLPGRGEVPRPGVSYVQGAPYPVSVWGADVTVGRRFVDLASRHPDRRAITWLGDDGDVRGLTWEEVRSRSGAVAASLDRRHPSRRRIGLIGDDRVQWIVAFYAAALGGHTVVPLPRGETVETLHDICNRARVEMVIATDGHPLARTDRVGPVPVDTVGALVADGSTGVWAPGDGAPDDPFLFQATSGTTGKPKFAALSHRALLGSAEGYARGGGATDGSVIFNPLPLEHVGGSVGGVMGALVVDGTYVAVDRFDPAVVASVIRKTSPTVVGLVPTMIIDMLERGAVDPDDFSSVLSVIGGATAVEPPLIDQLERKLGVTFLVAYGQSEAPCTTMTGLGDPTRIRTRTLGRPLPGRDCCICLEGRVVEDGIAGELYVRGPLIMSGYLGEDGTLADMTDGNGWMATGDLCSMREGVITFHSRAREVVIRGGENIYPAEIEAVLSACPEVAEVAVFGIPDHRLGEQVAAAVRGVGGVTVDIDAVASYAETNLPRRKRPVAWFPVADFPRTSTGKIRKVELAHQSLSSGAGVRRDGAHKQDVVDRTAAK